MSIQIGDKFGILTVVKPAVVNGRKGFECICDCGNLCSFSSNALLRGNNKSCGCIHKKHGLTGSRIYQAWGNMKRRCNDPSNKSYANYGGRGISYDPSWENFENFYEDMKDTYADNLTLDRIDVDGNYTKENCRWADKKTQANNTTTNQFLTYNGETMTVADFARRYNLDYELFRHRLQKGWSVEKAMEPVGQQEEITFNGETKTVSEWAKEIGLTYHQLKKRLMRGWTVERAITQPLRISPKSK